MNTREKLLKFCLSTSIVFAFCFDKFIKSIERQQQRAPMLDKCNNHGEEAKHRVSYVSTHSNDQKRRWGAPTIHESRPTSFSSKSKSNSNLEAHHPTKSDCSSRQNNDDERLQLGLMGKIAKFYSYLFVTYFSILLAKNIVLCLLDLDYFSDYRYLDCYLIGRLVLDGRFCGAAKYLAIVFCMFQLIWIYSLDFSDLEFSFLSLDFLSYSYSEVFEFEAAQPDGHRQRSQRAASSASERNFGRFLEQANLGRIKHHHQLPTFFFQDSLIASPANNYTLRPNRTTESWRRLAKFTLIYFLVALVVVALVAPFFFYHLATIVTTRLGYELSYAHCIDHIGHLQQQREHSPPSSSSNKFIYVPTKPLDQMLRERSNPPMVLPLVDTKPPTAYNLVTLLADVIDNSFFWTATGSSFVFDTYIVLVIALDVALYLEAIERRLLKLFEQMQCCQTKCFIGSCRRGSGGGNNGNDNMHEAAQVQAMLMDFFVLIGKYEAFVHYYFMFCMALWLTFTFTICVGIFSPSSALSLARAEIYALEVFASVYFCSIMGFFASLRDRIRRLYGQVASIMAMESLELEVDAWKSRERWALLMQHYYPTPLYCFSIFGAIEVNWFFGLKVSERLGVTLRPNTKERPTNQSARPMLSPQLVAWIFSVILIASSFERVLDPGPR